MKRVVILLTVVAFVAGMVGCQPAAAPGPDPAPSDHIEIRDWHDLDAIRDDLGRAYVLINDLDCTTPGYEELASPTANQGKGWEPIGTAIVLDPFSATQQYIPVDTFAGSFNGQGYEIRDLFVHRPHEDCVGLFGAVDEESVIENIGVLDACVTGHAYVGILAGFTGGPVSNFYSTGSVTGEGYVGGLAGATRGTVTDSYSLTNVTGGQRLGGLVGQSRSSVSNSYYNCDEVLINGKSMITVGALFGEDFVQWLANDKYLDVNERLSQQSACVVMNSVTAFKQPPAFDQDEDSGSFVPNDRFLGVSEQLSEEDDYYLVNNVSDFKQLLAFGQDDSLKFRLTADLDLAAEPDFYIPYLASEFDGNGHKILNLNLEIGLVSQVGLFGYLAPGGDITQLGVENVSITGNWTVGSLAGHNYGSITNCHSTGSVSGHGWIVGGLVGANEHVGIVSNSHCSNSVTGDEVVGGVVGMNDGTVYNCYSSGSLIGHWSVGGLVGENALGGTVSNSYSTGSVTGHELVGGLVGVNDESVTNSYSTGSVTGGGWTVGGLVGWNALGTVSNSYSTGGVTGTHRVGGLVGANSGTVSDSYSTGSVTGGSNIGGLVGRNEGKVTNSYYNFDDILINGQKAITIGALYDGDYNHWLAHDRSLDVNDRLSREDDYYMINDISDLKELLAFGQDGSLKFRLTADLDLAAEANFYIPYLAGEFEGDNHEIWNLSFNCDFVSQVGLFGYVASGGKVSQVGVENVNIAGDWFVGGLVGENAHGSAVSNCYSTGSVTGGGWSAGGLVARNTGTIGNSYSKVNVNGANNVGGLVGENAGTVSNSHCSGSVGGHSLVGGLVGENVGTVSNSLWDTETSGQATSAGGIGKTTAEMKNIATFSGVGWNIIAVANPDARNPSYIWNIVDDETYPFLSWQSVS